MKNITNIYDIDGELIRAAGDNHRFTLEEVLEMSRKYQDKLNKLTENDPKNPKIKVYEGYIENLGAYIFDIYSKMTPEQLKEVFKPIETEKTDENEVQKAIKELKEALENDGETEENTTNEVSESTTGNTEGNDNKELRDDDIIEQPESSVHEKRSVSQSDLLVERDNVTTNMDEYVEFTEVEDTI